MRVLQVKYAFPAEAAETVIALALEGCAEDKNTFVGDGTQADEECPF